MQSGARRDAPYLDGSSARSDKLPQAAIRRRGNAAEKVVERRTAGIEKPQKNTAGLTRVFHGELPESLVENLRRWHSASTVTGTPPFHLRAGR